MARKNPQYLLIDPRGWRCRYAMWCRNKAAFLTNRRFLTSCSIGALLILIAAYIASVYIVIQVYNVLQEYRNSRQEYFSIYKTLLLLDEMESSQRGYLLTDDTTYLVTYNDALPLIDTAIAATKKDLGTDSQDLLEFQQATQLISSKRIEMQNTIDLEKAGRKSEALALVKTDQGLFAGIDAHVLLNNILDRQATKIQANYQNMISGVRINLRITFWGSIFGVLLVIGNLIGMRFFMSTTRKAEMQRDAQRKEVDQTKQWYLNITQSSTDGFISITPLGIVTFWNKAAEHMFGYTSEEMVGNTLEYIMPPELYSRHQEGLRRLFQGFPSRIIGTTLEMEGLRRDGKRFPIELLISIWASEAEGKMFTATIRDISERKSAEAALLKSNTELERFAYIASHDLQEPLRMVTSYMQLLEKKYKDQLDVPAQRYIGYAVSGSQRMKNLIQDLLVYSRVTSTPKEMVKTNLNHCLDSALLNLQKVIEDTNTIIERDDLPFVCGDSIWLTQVFQNLVANSIKFRKLDVSPRITIRCTSENTMWRIDIADNGIGFDMAYVEKIFIVFQKLHRKEEYEGTGIGLSICKKVIEQHGGTITANSIIDQGSIFSFTLPKFVES